MKGGGGGRRMQCGGWRVDGWRERRVDGWRAEGGACGCRWRWRRGYGCFGAEQEEAGREEAGQEEAG